MEISKADIIDLEEQLIEGIKSNNIKFLEHILHDDLLFMIPNGQIITKEADLASHRSGEMKVEQLTSSIEEIKIIGDTAIVTLVYNTTGEMLGTRIEGKFRYIRIWKRFSEGLKIIGGSCFKIE